MENSAPDSSSPQPIFDLQVDESASRNLWSITGWARFLAIAVFIGIGLVLVAFFSMRDQISTSVSRFIPDMDWAGLVYGVIIFAAIICLVLFVFLLRGAILIRKGMLAKDQLVFNRGLASFKNFFIMYGLLGIITIILNIIGFFVT